jgi:hypothetical protein
LPHGTKRTRGLCVRGSNRQCRPKGAKQLPTRHHPLIVAAQQGIYFLSHITSSLAGIENDQLSDNHPWSIA